MPSSNDLSPEQLRAIAGRAAAFRDYCQRLSDRAEALKWPRDDPLFVKFREAWERASWLAVAAATKANEREGKG